MDWGIAVLLLLLAGFFGGGAAFVYCVIRAQAAYWRPGGSPLGSSWWSTDPVVRSYRHIALIAWLVGAASIGTLILLLKL